ncbi:hypothetical protein SNEBB_004727 [Seison nebaliae]|nr:hypothetical protein SNEBB_004727 [Seison nebaliae]
MNFENVLGDKSKCEYISNDMDEATKDIINELLGPFGEQNNIDISNINEKDELKKDQDTSNDHSQEIKYFQQDANIEQTTLNNNLTFASRTDTSINSESNKKEIENDKFSIYPPLIFTQANIYINGTAYHYELKLVPNQTTSYEMDNKLNKQTNIINSDKNDNFSKDNITRSKLIMNNLISDQETQRISKQMTRLTRNFIDESEQFHHYKSFYPQMPINEHSRISYGNLENQIILRTMDEGESSLIEKNIARTYYLNQLDELSY